jgi:hypothetical protein
MIIGYFGWSCIPLCRKSRPQKYHGNRTAESCADSFSANYTIARPPAATNDIENTVFCALSADSRKDDPCPK